MSVSKIARAGKLAVHHEEVLLRSRRLARRPQHGRFAEFDIAHQVDEIEYVGKSAERELASCCPVLTTDLLHWRLQHSIGLGSGRATIDVQEDRIAMAWQQTRGLTNLPREPELRRRVRLDPQI